MPVSQTHVESSCWEEEPEKRRTKKQIEQIECHSQLHGFTWWRPSLKGQLHCNSVRPTRRSFTVLSGMIQKWNQSSGGSRPLLRWREGSPKLHTKMWVVVCVYRIFSIPLNLSLDVTLERSKSPSDECLLPLWRRWPWHVRAGRLNLRPDQICIYMHFKSSFSIN